uniref:PREDICTED: similar to tigger transposable element derived 4 putative n=1 Tax=Albugo laibachii Nc14 TaxID=890382 RepID=F0W8G1_9STRA|nr:PREDICTED: similar to tigger transposable element derived 4 putative [Albugo laibachii Nc14]|eukprot:CCA17416.1 PREDICTED: similar to tigger transposable element derived 4 putative [Albugo laibachii Nc14]
MDESAYSYCMAPSNSATKASISGRKKIKKRLTVAITTKADGCCKMPLFFIGNARQPRCFISQSASKLGFDYANAAKGWMTTAIFRCWLAHFNEKMQGMDSHVLLLLDNASRHRVSEQFSNVTLQFLPPNNSAHLQPHDAGIIQSFKSQMYKTRIAHVVDKLDELLEQVDGMGKENVKINGEQLFDVNILVVMRWAQESWGAVTQATVANCWRHTGIFGEDIFELVTDMHKLHIGPHTDREQVV